jgi:hypothetical protein
MSSMGTYLLIGLIVATIVVVRLSLSSRIGGEPRRSWFRRTATKPTVAPTDAPTDAFAGDLSLATDPNLARERLAINQRLFSTNTNR